MIYNDSFSLDLLIDSTKDLFILVKDQLNVLVNSIIKRLFLSIIL